MLKASDVMTQDVATIRGSATVADAVKLMKMKTLRALIVDLRAGQDAYGIFTHSDIVTNVVAYGTDLKTVRVYEIMTKPCIVVNPDLGVEYVARLFANTGIRIAPVIQGDLLGIISESDILYKGDFLENRGVGLETDDRAAPVRLLPDCSDRGFGNAFQVALHVDLPVQVDDGLAPGGKGVHDGNANAVQTA
jgi:CBS domain-containing protein